ncbi:NADH:ubiquinone oxidoreductase [Saitoella coloradoensis]
MFRSAAARAAFRAPSAARQVARRWNSTAAPVEPVPVKKTGFFKKAWRATYISAIVGAGAFAYVIYDDRHPENQLPTDPSKKTLVVLGSGWASTSLLKSLDTENYNVVVVSPRNYFLFTPLLPSTPTGTIELRSIMQPIRHILRHKKAAVNFFEAEATEIDHENKILKIRDNSDVTGDVKENSIKYDYLVVGCGAETQTFGIPGVEEFGCFLKEIWDAQKIRTRIMDCVEAALFKDQTPEEKKRLLHTVVVGGGPTGIEFAAELADFLEEDLRRWYPEIKDDYQVTLIEAMTNVLPMFSKKLIQYTEDTFAEQNITIHTKTMVKSVDEKYISVSVTQPDGTSELQKIPYGLLVWAGGNKPRKVVVDIMKKLPAQKNARRGLSVNDYLVVEGCEGIWALGDASQTKYAPTAQVAAQQGSYLGRLFNSMARTHSLEADIAYLQSQLAVTPVGTPARAGLEAELEAVGKALSRTKQMSPFHYSHQGSLAYIGSDKAIADLQLPFMKDLFSSGGAATYLFWRSAYVSNLFSLRNKTLVVFDWVKVKMFGRDVSRE